MPLKEWVEWDKELFSHFAKSKFDITGEIKAPPITKHYMLVGTAFDYALRFLITKVNELPPPDSWVAEGGLEINASPRRKEFLEGTGNKFMDYAYAGDDAVSIEDLLPGCITLAKMDEIFRSGKDYPDDELFGIDPDDVKDLGNLISIVDTSLFKTKGECILNPHFGQSGIDIGGADADLMIGNCLIDIKTTMYLRFTLAHFRQLMGYYILNLRNQRLLGKHYERGINEVGTIKVLGIYYSRYGKLFTFPVKDADYCNWFELSPNIIWEIIEESIKEYNS